MAGVKIDSRGVVVEGNGSGVTISLPVVFSSGQMTAQLSCSAGTTTGSVAGPKFYYVTGGTDRPLFSIPSAGTYPGGVIWLSEVYGQPFDLTGSAWSASKHVFALSTRISGGNPVAGTKMLCGAGSSVRLESDGHYWYATAGTGSWAFGGFNTQNALA